MPPGRLGPSRHVAAAVLGVQEALHSGRLQRVRRDAVDGVGGNDNQVTVGESILGRCQALVTFGGKIETPPAQLIGFSVRQLTHRPILARVCP